MSQKIIFCENDYSSIDHWFARVKNVMLVCGKSIENQPINEYFKATRFKLVRFSEFAPNPTYESVLLGLERFRRAQCDSIVAVGGGSAIDVAKCIKLFSNMTGSGEDGQFLTQRVDSNVDVPFLAIPTTAGTGSESTKFAVIYYNKEKQSVTHENCLPDTVLLDARLLKTLPIYQRKATMCDALCHAIESFWSVRSTQESKSYAREAIAEILKHKDGYLSNTDEGNFGMLRAANVAGKAINITQTTAGHAMCYKLTSLFNVAHGHAAMLCNRILYAWTIKHTAECVDSRGRDYLETTLDDIGIALGCEDSATGAKKLESIFRELDLDVPVATPQEFAELVANVNLVRLKNHPVRLTDEAIAEIYHEILRTS